MQYLSFNQKLLDEITKEDIIEILKTWLSKCDYDFSNKKIYLFYFRKGFFKVLPTSEKIMEN